MISIEHGKQKMRVLLIVLLLINSSTSFASELAEREAMNSLVANLFVGEKFDKLEELATRYRANKEKTSSGIWKLEVFYGALAFVGQQFEKNDDAGWQSRFALASRWVDRFPTSASARLTKGILWAARGSAYRGEDYINQTPKEDLIAFEKYEGMALQYLLANRDIAAVDPHWYVSVLGLETALGTTPKHLWVLLREGLDRYPNYDQIYFVAAIAFSPQWYGSKQEIGQEIEALAREALARTSRERGNELYARIYWAAPVKPDGTRHFRGPYADWEVMKSGMDAVLAKYPDQWNINHFAFFSCLKGDYLKTSELIGMIKEPIVMDAWHNEANFKLCKDDVDVYRRGLVRTK